MWEKCIYGVALLEQSARLQWSHGTPRLGTDFSEWLSHCVLMTATETQGRMAGSLNNRGRSV